MIGKMVTTTKSTSTWRYQKVGKQGMDRLLIGHGLPALFWLSSYVASPHLAVVPQLVAKDQVG
jgi:hypothetical protein